MLQQEKQHIEEYMETGIDQEFQFYEDDFSSNESENSSFTNLFQCKNLFLGLGMMFFYQFAGYNVVANYAGVILQADKDQLLNSTSVAKSERQE